LIILLFFFFFFFFQAEDGIRDLTVTGVQTCALPILAATDRVKKVPLNRSLGEAFNSPVFPVVSSHDGEGRINGDLGPAVLRLNRSEERRVGKECRSRWWAYHERKERRRRS